MPAKKTDYVQGRYEFPAPEGETTVAAKVVDMLGEEVVVTRGLQTPKWGRELRTGTRLGVAADDRAR